MKDDIDDSDVSEVGFEPAVSATGADVADPKPSAPRARKSRNALQRRIGASAILLAALTSMGGVYAAFAAPSGAASNGTSAADISAGRQLFQTSCITCHGANLEGVKDQGPPLIGVGQAAVYFQVKTGRMPAAGQGAYIARKDPKFDEAQIDQLAAYVESVGGGPTIPQGNLRGTDGQIADGGVLFRLNCASCHGATGKGAPLSAGKNAPSLNEATDKEFYGAMLSGPENMPVFSDNSITPVEKKSIIAYVQTLKASQDPGGAGIDRIGPVSEAVVIWVGGVGALMLTILWIGARSR
ncbi:MAG: c-type cytochrome [Actinomycetota bacterium]|nr:c-type cytochrome [Actinomycetota bacterium]